MRYYKKANEQTILNYGQPGFQKQETKKDVTSCRAQDQASPRVVRTPELFLPLLCSGSQKASSPVATLCAIYLEKKCARGCSQVETPEAKSARLGTTRRSLPRTTTTPTTAATTAGQEHCLSSAAQRGRHSAGECVGARGSPRESVITSEIACDLLRFAQSLRRRLAAGRSVEFHVLQKFVPVNLRTNRSKQNAPFVSLGKLNRLEARTGTSETSKNPS